MRVVAAVIEYNGNIYAVERSYGGFKGMWEFPGGKVKMGETDKEALKREVEENFDAEVFVEKYLGIVEYDYPRFHLSMACYLCHVKNRHLTIVGHRATEWMSRDELQNVEWLPEDWIVVSKFLISKPTIMLTVPSVGWTYFSLGGKEWPLSYLTDVPMEWLDTAIWGLQNLLPFTVHGQCEPGKVLCTVAYDHCYILFDDEDPELKRENTILEVFDITMWTFCRYLYQDIFNHVEDWANYSYEYSEDEKKAQQARQLLEKKLAKMKSLLAEKEKCQNVVFF